MNPVAIETHMRTLRYADVRWDAEPLVALLDEIEQAYRNEAAKRKHELPDSLAAVSTWVTKDTPLAVQQLVPALRSLTRLREMLARLDAKDDESRQLIADTCQLFSPFLDGQPLQQALADVLAMPVFRTGRTRGSQTTQDKAQQATQQMTDWISTQLKAYVPADPDDLEREPVTPAAFLAKRVMAAIGPTTPAVLQAVLTRQRAATADDDEKREASLRRFFDAHLRKHGSTA
jgi:hypothetical protein